MEPLSLSLVIKDPFLVLSPPVLVFFFDAPISMIQFKLILSSLISTSTQGLCVYVDSEGRTSMPFSFQRLSSADKQEVSRWMMGGGL